MVSAEGGSVPNGVGYGEGCPLSSRLGGLGERRELPQQGPGQSPDRKRVLAYFEGHRTLFLYLYDKNLRGTICISVPYSKFWGDLSPCPPRDLCPCQSDIQHQGSYLQSRSIDCFRLLGGLVKKLLINRPNWARMCVLTRKTRNNRPALLNTSCYY